MKIALLPSTQWRNPVSGGGTEAQYAHEVCHNLKPILENAGHEVLIFSAAKTADEWSEERDANAQGAREAVKWGAEFVLSVHSDGGYMPRDHLSAMVLYQPPQRHELAVKFLNAYCKYTGYRPRGVQQRVPGVNGIAVLRIPESAGIPALLLERGWHDREPDATDIRTRSEWFASAIASALLEIYKRHKVLVKYKESPHGGEVETVLFEYDRIDSTSKQYVYVLPVPAKPNDVIGIFADVPNHDVEMTVYVHPVVGESLSKKIRVGGYGNRDNVHGGLYTVEQLYPGLKMSAWIVVHSPVALHGGIMR